MWDLLASSQKIHMIVEVVDLQISNQTSTYRLIRAMIDEHTQHVRNNKELTTNLSLFHKKVNIWIETW
jgi:hypothetical protein